MIYISDVLTTSICPDRAHVRTILASVFNRDVRDDQVEELSPTEAVVVLASKMLLDMNYKTGYVQAIFRLNKARLLKKKLDGVIPLLISLSDNRYVAVFGDVNDFVPVYDYTTGKRSRKARAPLMTMIIDLSKLLRVVQEAVDQRESRSPEADS